ncbi:hypothetical protein FISHEDRAFT_38010, partial [Fistulina hepatica ATCC 64428]
AEDALAKGLLIPAAEEHLKAANAFLAASEKCSDESTKRTLRMLHADHSKSAKDLQRRIDALRQEGKDPSLPQKPDPPKPAPRVNPGFATPTRSVPSPTPSLRHMTDSQNAVDESFMLLAGQRSDPGDAFHQFWSIMQGLLDNLSQPVAFATAPLGTEADTSKKGSGPASAKHLQEGSVGSDTDEEHLVTRLTRRLGITGSSGRRGESSRTASSASESPKSPIYNVVDDDFEIEDGDELSESFLVIPSGQESNPAVLRKENAVLKAEIEVMKKQLQRTEHVIQMRREQDMQLRDSVYQATREAQRLIGQSALLQRSPAELAAVGVPPPIPLPTGREAQYVRRIKDLEDELRGARAENEKHKASIVKYKERWEKLKESAKRKKEAKAAAAAVRETIVEEPDDKPDAVNSPVE